jgi:SH3-like domain-containing protein
MRRRHFALGALVLAVALATVRAGEMSVQVREGPVRATPSFLGQVVGNLAYGDRVQVLGQRPGWMQVSARGGLSGWMHQSALTEKRVVLRAGSADVQTGASGEELALAGKGFNSDVEADFKAKNRNVDFTWVDKMEKIKVAPEAMQRFLKDGGIQPHEGGKP